MANHDLAPIGAPEHNRPVPPAASAEEALERVIAAGDLARLSPRDRVTYYMAVCKSAGLNPFTKPFDYLQLNGKLVLYANKGATDQLRAQRGISVTIVSRETLDGLYVVTARATDSSGRSDEDVGVVTVGGAKADILANLLMKAHTKAKRRVTLSHCGLGMLDESEVDTIPGAKVVEMDPLPRELVKVPAAIPAAAAAPAQVRKRVVTQATIEAKIAPPPPAPAAELEVDPEMAEKEPAPPAEPLPPPPTPPKNAASGNLRNFLNGNGKRS